MEGIDSVKALVRPKDRFIKIDLTDAYLTVPVHPEYHKFLQFSWEGKLFRFVCLPFGLSSAPRVFTKLLKPVVAFFTGKRSPASHISGRPLDYWLECRGTTGKQQITIDLLQKLFERFRLKLKKSVLIPS